MRICMLLDAVYPTDIRVAKEARALSEAGHEVFLLSYWDADLPTRETVGSLEVIRRPLRHAHGGVEGILPGVRYLATGVHEAWADALRAVVGEENIDAVHVHDLPLVKTGLAVGEEYDLPVVADLHENWPEAVRQYRAVDTLRDLMNYRYAVSRLATPIRRWKRIERDCVRRADRVVTVVDEARDHYVRDCGAAPSKVHVVSNVVDLETYDATDVSPVDYADDEEFVLLYVGTLGGRHRGLGTVVRAMPSLRERVPGAHLVIVGSGGGYETELRELSTDLGVRGCVTFTGRVPFEEVPSHIAASDACLVPHRSTGHTETTVPHKLFQYMAGERPVVVSDVAPLSRVVSETDAGLVFPAADADGMADVAAKLAADPERAAEMGANGRRAVETRYNWAAESERLLECYRALDPGMSGATTAAPPRSTE